MHTAAVTCAALLIGRTNVPVAVVPGELGTPQLDNTAALGVLASLSPVVLSLHWGLTLNEAQDRLQEADKEYQDAYMTIISGGDGAAFEECQAELEECQAKLEAAKPLKLAGASMQLVQQSLPPILTSVPAVRRMRLAKARIARRMPKIMPPYVPALRQVAGQRQWRSLTTTKMEMGAEEPADGEAGPEDAATKSSLDAKMAAWEASEEEARGSTLGGNLPLVGMPGLPGRMTRTDQPKTLDAFDVFMNLSGAILLPLALVVLTVPFWIGNIDISDAGPPPGM